MHDTAAQFGFVVGTAFVILAGAFFWAESFLWTGFLAGGVLLVVLAALNPADLRLAERWWMRLAYVLGWIVSRLILALFYYLIVTPIGLIGRAFGARFLDRQPRRGGGTYWRAREESTHDYEHQF